MKWTADPKILACIRQQAGIDQDLINNLFGPEDLSELALHPYSLAAKLSCRNEDGSLIPNAIGIQPEDFAGGVSFGCSIDLSGHEVSATTDGVPTEITDVTAYGVTPGDVDVPVAEANFSALKAAIEAAYASNAKIVWFPATDAGNMYEFRATGGEHGLPIYPGLTYRGARGVTVFRSDNTSDEFAAVFTTRPTGAGPTAAPSFVNKSVTFDGLTIRSPNTPTGCSGILIHCDYAGVGVNGHFRIRDCTFHNCRHGSYARHGISTSKAEFVSVRNCAFHDCDSNVIATSGTRLIQSCSGSHTYPNTPRAGKGFELSDETGYGVGPFSYISSCHARGTHKQAYTAFALTDLAGKESILGCTTTVAPSNQASQVHYGISLAGKNVTAIGNVVNPDMRLALQDVDYGIYVSPSAVDCIVAGNRVGAYQVILPSRIDKGIVTTTTQANRGRHRIQGNVILTNVRTPMEGNPRDSKVGATDALADLIRYDYETTGVCVTDTSYAYTTNEPREDGSVRTFDPLGHGLNGDVRVVVGTGASYSDALYAGGTCTNTGATPIGRIAKWDGCKWTQGVGSGFNGAVNCIVKDGDRLWIGGSFTQTIDNPSGNLSSLVYSDDEGRTVSKIINVNGGKPFYGFIKADTTSIGPVWSVQPWVNGWLAIAGEFQWLRWGTPGAYINVRVNNFVLYHPTAGFYTTGMDEGPGQNADEWVTKITPLPGGDLLLTGRFYSPLGGYSAPRNLVDFFNVAICYKTNDGFFFKPAGSFWFADNAEENYYVDTAAVVGPYVLLGTAGPGRMFRRKSGGGMEGVDIGSVVTLVYSGSGEDGVTGHVGIYHLGHAWWPREVQIPGGSTRLYDILPVGSEGGNHRGVVAMRGGIGYYNVQERLYQDHEGGEFPDPVTTITLAQQQPVPNGESYDYKSLSFYRGRLILGGNFGAGHRQSGQTYDQRAYGRNMNLISR